MKLLEKVKEIFDKYNYTPIELPEEYGNLYRYLDEHLEEYWKYESKSDDSYLIEKYSKYIPKGHYGFSIGHPTPNAWNDIIEEILDLCIKEDPNFEIHQIKTKFGRICFYVHSDTIEDIFDIEVLIGNKLFDEALIY